MQNPIAKQPRWKSRLKNHSLSQLDNGGSEWPPQFNSPPGYGFTNLGLTYADIIIVQLSLAEKHVVAPEDAEKRGFQKGKGSSRYSIPFHYSSGILS